MGELEEEEELKDEIIQEINAVSEVIKQSTVLKAMSTVRPTPT